jgi:hypothetical protein
MLDGLMMDACLGLLPDSTNVKAVHSFDVRAFNTAKKDRARGHTGLHKWNLAAQLHSKSLRRQRIKLWIDLSK